MSCQGNFFIHAVNVHVGGGKRLLSGLINSLNLQNKTFLLLDKRMEFDEHLKSKTNIKIRQYPPTILSRLKAEFFLKKYSKAHDYVLCFGNLPPFFQLKAKVTVFLQNKYLIEEADLKDFSFKVRLRLRIERLWFRVMAAHVNKFIVQGPSMELALRKFLKKDISIEVFPFIDQSPENFFPKLKENYHPQDFSNRPYDFVYLASGEPHKNHHKLIQAWILLAKENVFPHLCLTLSNQTSFQLFQWIESMKEIWNLKISFWDPLSKNEDGLELYNKSRSLIFPSILESLGLPLIEARQKGLPIIAAELDYVRDIVDPEETFNPLSEYSIAKAVKRFLKCDHRILKLEGPDSFIKRVLEQ